MNAEVDIDGLALLVSLVGFWLLESNNVSAEGLAVSLDKPLAWAIRFFFGNAELSMRLGATIAGMLRFGD